MRSVNPLLGGVLVWGSQTKRPAVQPSHLGFHGFQFFVAPIPASGPATDGRAVQGIHLFPNYRNPRQMDHLTGIFYEAKLSNVAVQARAERSGARRLQPRVGL